MKVELHCHTNRYSACAGHSPQQAMGDLIAQGYEAVYLTEHNAVWSEEEIAELQEQFPQIRIFPGVEWSPLFYGRHEVLVLGTSDPAVLSIQNDDALLVWARQQGCLAVLAHPFRREGGNDMLSAGLRPDAMEYQTCNVTGNAAENARKVAGELGVALVNAGDLHVASMIGHVWLETNGPVEQANDIRRIVLAGAYKNCSSG